MNEQVSGGFGRGGEEPASLSAGAGLLDRLVAAAKVREAAVRDLVGVLAAANRAGVVEPLEGLPMSSTRRQAGC